MEKARKSGNLKENKLLSYLKNAVLKSSSSSSSSMSEVEESNPSAKTEEILSLVSFSAYCEI